MAEAASAQRVGRLLDTDVHAGRPLLCNHCRGGGVLTCSMSWCRLPPLSRVGVAGQLGAARS